MTRIKIRARVAVTALLAAGITAVAGPAVVASANSQDETWMVAAHQSNLAEIAAGTDAKQNATASSIKDLGAMLVSDHTKLDASLKTLAAKHSVDLPDQPTAAQKAALAKVKSNSGQAYDTAWVKSQITGHLQTRAATRKELSGGSESDVLAAAKSATPVVQHHINELISIAGDLGISAPSSVPGGTGGQAQPASALTPIMLIVAGLGALGAMAALLRRRSVRV